MNLVSLDLYEFEDLGYKVSPTCYVLVHVSIRL